MPEEEFAFSKRTPSMVEAIPPRLFCSFIYPDTVPSFCILKASFLTIALISCTSCTQVHGLPQSHCGKSLKGTQYSQSSRKTESSQILKNQDEHNIHICSALRDLVPLAQFKKIFRIFFSNYREIRIVESLSYSNFQV